MGHYSAIKEEESTYREIIEKLSLLPKFNLNWYNGKISIWMWTGRHCLIGGVFQKEYSEICENNIQKPLNITQ